MKKLAFAMALIIPFAAHAQPLFHPSGSNLTNGMSSNSPSVISITNNPAAAAATLTREENSTTTAIGVISSIGISTELGQVDNFSQQIDDLSTQLDRTNLTLAEGQQIESDFNDFLLLAERDGYLIINAAAHVPAMPFMINSETLGGAITLDINAAVQAYLGVLSAPLSYNAITQEMTTDSAFYIKGATVLEASVGYSRKVWNNQHGNLFAGVTGKYYQVGLSKNVIPLMDDANNDVGDTLADEFEQNQNTSTGIGIDLGVLWVANNYSLGATLANANSPRFDYGEIGNDCNLLTGSAQSNCLAAATHSNKIDLTETYTMDAQLRIEGSLHSQNKHWQLSASYDGNAVYGPVGNEMQWATLAVGYAPDNWIPGVRVGYRKNMAGSELSMATFGLTLIKGLNLDVGYGLEEVEEDGEKYPRTLAVNLGLEMRF
ncbi:MAG: conjugal transfer protein TraF [Gammaproteobacteria bacterium]|nr:conjugal transfer protein TraF [Gammaproteobacteria bacterium]MCF6229312.1 conjugal transfer protein TraF [Gammaproteobacteria bacterium]